MSMQPRSWPEPSPEVAAAVRGMYRRRRAPLPVVVRDELGEVFADADFVAGFGVRGRPGWSPGRLALVTALQFVENLTDRQAAEAVRVRLDWKYALGLSLADEGFDASVLTEFRARLVGRGLEEKALDVLLAALVDKGLVRAGGRQRTDSTHVVAAVRELNRLELAGEALRAAVQALAVAAPDWLAGVVDVGVWAQRYGLRMDSWRLPSQPGKRAQLAVVYGADGWALLTALFDQRRSPQWLARLPAVQVLRQVWVQNFVIVADRSGREVVCWREADVHGLPPGRWRIVSPYDTDARWGGKGDLHWRGYKVHFSETCGPEPGPEPGVSGGSPRREFHAITGVVTTDASVTDNQMTETIHAGLARRGLLPDRHLVDSGYPSADLLVSSATDFGVRLVSPMLTDNSAQARAGNGYHGAAFNVDFDLRQATCPQGATSVSWNPQIIRGHEMINVRFPAAACRTCPVRALCTSSHPNRGRQLTIRPRPVHQARAAARAHQDSDEFKTLYKQRAGIEGTISQAVAISDTRHARYRGHAKTHLQHVFTAVALNLIRLHAWHHNIPIDRGHTSQLTRLSLTLAA
jgi:transposase